MTTWVFLRGLTRESRHWGEFPAMFSRTVPGARVLALDLPGNGRLNGRESPARVSEMAEYCRAELIRQGVPPPYHLLAMSLGAMAAVAWASLHPREIAGCVLVNTSLRGYSPFYHRLRPRSYPTLLKLLFRGGEPRDWEEAILGLTSQHRHNAEPTLADWVTYRTHHPVSRRNALRQLLAAARYRPPSTRPPVPVLILAGQHDRLVNCRCSQVLAARWGVPLVLHPDAGHDLPLDDGPWVIQQVRQWLLSGAAVPQPAAATATPPEEAALEA